MHAHINFIDGYVNWRGFFMECSKQKEGGGYVPAGQEDTTVYTRVIKKVDPLFEAYLEAVYQMARLMQGNQSAQHIHTKAEYLKRKLNNYLAAEREVWSWSQSEVANTLDNVDSSGFIQNHNTWTTDPIRRRPLPADRTMLPAEQNLPVQRSKCNRSLLWSRTTGTIEAAANVENFLSEVDLTVGGQPPPARAPNAAGPASYAQAATRKRRAPVNPFRDDGSFFDDGSDGFDEEDTPVGSVFKRYVTHTPMWMSFI